MNFNIYRATVALIFSSALLGGNAMALDSRKVFGDERYQKLAGAIERGDIAAINKFQSTFAVNWKITGANGMTLGHFALHAPTPETLDHVLEKGADPVARLDDGNTLAHYTLGKDDATGQRTDAWLAVVLKHGAPPDLIGTSANWTLAKTAVSYKNIKALELLARSGANLSLVGPNNDGTPIHAALTINNMPLAARIAELGGDPRVKDGFGENAADYYCTSKKGKYMEARRPEFEIMRVAFKRYGLDIPCGF